MFSKAYKNTQHHTRVRSLAILFRSCYDLEMHSKKTGVAMLASCKLDKPQEVTEYKLQIDRKALGKTFKAEQKKVQTAAYHQLGQ